MRISVFGLGYVGAVSAACLAKSNHEIVGVDVNASKVQQFNAGYAPITEPGLQELIAQGVANKTLRATTSAAEAVAETELSIICVGTPTNANGQQNLAHIEGVSTEIGHAIARKAAGHVVVIRSTVLPGTTRRLVIPTLELASKNINGEHFFVAHNPEFLREGSAIVDFFNPARTVIGANDNSTAQRVAALYSSINAPVITTTFETSEMVKIVDNVWHALKVCFGNEIGAICKASGVNSQAVSDIFCLDTKLNISTAYLKPGFAFGGSCLPKDTRALYRRARDLNLDAPLLGGILPSNSSQIERAVKTILSLNRRRVALLGLSFKPGTDDLRESPFVELSKRLLAEGCDVKVYDPALAVAALTGANRDFFLTALPHLYQMLVNSLDEALDHADVVVAAHKSPNFKSLGASLREHQIVVDLVGLASVKHLGERYHGINW